MIAGRKDLWVVACLCGLGWGNAAFSEGPLVVQGGRCRVVVNPTDGSLTALDEAGKDRGVLTAAGLWRIEFDDRSTLEATQFRAGGRSIESQHEPASNRCELTYRSSEAVVSVTIAGRPEGVDLVGQVTPAKKTVLEFALPGR